MPDLPFRDLAKLQEQGFYASDAARDKAIDRALLRLYKDAFDRTSADIAKLYAKVGLSTPVSTPSGPIYIRKEDAIRYNQLANKLQNLADEMTALRGQGVKLTEETSAQAMQDGYYRNVWAYGQAVGVELHIPSLPIGAIRASVYSEVSGLDLVKTWAKNTTAGIYSTQSAIMRGITNGDSYTKVARKIKGEFDKGLWQAQRVVRTEAGRCWSEGAEDAHGQAVEAGLQVRKRWSATLDKRTRSEHGHMDGTYADENGLFWMSGLSAPQPREFGSPELDINCIPEDSIAIGIDTEKLYRRHYDGVMVRIETAIGNKFSVTPNHPILTERGWVKASKIVNGESIISVNLGKVRKVGKPDIEYAPPIIAQIFDLFSIIGSKQGMGGSKEQFHGDGEYSNVDIVSFNRHLWNRFESAFYKPLIKRIFSLADILPSLLSRNSTRDEFWNPSFHPAYSIMRILGKARALLWRRFGHSHKHSIGSAPNASSGFFEDAADWTTRYVVLLCKSLFGRSAKIVSDKVISIRSEPFSGHVYNLQTSNSWYGLYSGNGNMSIVHNCRCAVYDVLDGISPEVRRIRDEGIQPYVKFDEWASAKGFDPVKGWPKVSMK
jgi:hypothetical protein